MGNEVKPVARKSWSRPQVRKIEAGAAETGPTGSPDGGPGGNNKS